MKHLIKRMTVMFAILGIIVLGSALSASADDITDSINEGLENYKKGDVSAAIQSLNYATQLMMQTKAQGLEAYLPAPLSGWTAEPSNSTAAGAAMFGGGVSAERTYTKDSSQVTIQILTDSPLMQGVMMMFSNPMFAASEGGKLEKVGKQKAIVTYNENDRDGNIKIVVANRFFVSIEGNGVTKEDLTAYAKKVDYDKLAAMP
ncbi:MAG: hypothetical protein V1793_06845 [Pseudomonadota bacterium]